MPSDKAYHDKYYQDNKDKILAGHLALRLEVLEHYGKVCKNCGEDWYVVLVIDHVDGGGTKHRKVIGGGEKINRWLKKNNWPNGYQVLCHNCNWAKHRGLVRPKNKPL